MSELRMLDLFACEGGASAGYAHAGWDVTAVDLDPNRLKHNPYGAHVGDALDFLDRHVHEFDAVHASPPCQWYTRGNAPRRGEASKWERTIPPVREALEATGLPYVIENVKDAAWDMRDPVTLCGCMFGLTATDTDGITLHLQRPRLFETNWTLTPPRLCDHSEHEWVAGAYGGARRDKYEAKYVRKGGYVPRDKAVVQALLGVSHPMTWRGLFECVPPRYSQHVGGQLRAQVEAVAA